MVYEADFGEVGFCCEVLPHLEGWGRLASCEIEGKRGRTKAAARPSFTPSRRFCVRRE